MTKIITEPKNLYGFLATPGVEVMNIAFVSDDVAYISWMYYAEEDVPNLRHTNEVIGTYVTAGARIHHYRYFDRLRENAMYCDTDCVIYIQPRGEPPLIERGTISGHDIRVALLREHFGICEWWAKEQRVQITRYRGRSRKGCV